MPVLWRVISEFPPLAPLLPPDVAKSMTGPGISEALRQYVIATSLDEAESVCAFLKECSPEGSHWIQLCEFDE